MLQRGTDSDVQRLQVSGGHDALMSLVECVWRCCRVFSGVSMKASHVDECVCVCVCVNHRLLLVVLLPELEPLELRSSYTLISI